MASWHFYLSLVHMCIVEVRVYRAESSLVTSLLRPICQNVGGRLYYVSPTYCSVQLRDLASALESRIWTLQSLL